MAPSPSSWTPAWEELVVTLLLAGAYAVASRRYGTTRLRAASFAAALLLVLAVSVTPLGTLALHYLLTAHLVQNVVLAEWAPALAVAGLSAPMAAALARRLPLRTLAHPLVALPVWVLAYVVWHLPPLYEAALEHHLLLHLEHATYFLSGTLLWWPLLQAEPRRLGAGGKSAYLFAAFVFSAPLGLMLSLAPEPFYDFYAEAPRVWGLAPLRDQQIAGVAMSVAEAVVFFAVFARFFVRFMAEEEAGYGRPPAAGRD
jgi:cytochrome c oxidase assembly factor CtaG